MPLKRLVAFVITAAGAVALLLAAVGAPAWVAMLVGGGALCGVVVSQRRRLLTAGTSSMGAFAPTRIMVAAAVLVCLGRTGLDLWTGLAGAMAVTALLATSLEAQAARIWRGGTRVTHNVPGLDLSSRASRHGNLTVLGSVAVIVACAVAIWAPLAGGLLACGLGGVLTVVALRWTATAMRVKPTLNAQVAVALEEYAAPVMVYLTGPGGTEYQLGVWLDQLAALRERVVLVVRETALANAVAAMTDLPVVGAPTLGDLEALHVPAFRVCLYVNNGAKNSHNVRYRDVTHVQLLHGDSDKPSSYNPVTAMFDKIFVAGRAGIERYAAHGVRIPDEKFEIVGRPQVAGITAAAAPGEIGTVLYAPTWTGFNADNNFGSLAAGTSIVHALIQRGWRVVFRPHPYSLRDAVSRAQIEDIEQLLQADASAHGRDHVFGEAAQGQMTIVECFNMSDALVSDVSSVPADYLYSEKPFVIVQVTEQPAPEFLEEFPLARAAYVAQASDPSSIVTAIARLASDDLAPERRTMRVHYLGDIPRDTYAQTFVDAVTGLVTANPLSERVPHAVDRSESATTDDEGDDL